MPTFRSPNNLRTSEELVGDQDNPNVTVQIGKIESDDEEGTTKDDGDGSDSIFSDYSVNNHYEKDGHIYMLSIATEEALNQNVLTTGAVRRNIFTSNTPSNKDTVAFVKLGGHTLLWIADWTASKSKKPPQIPDPLRVIDNWVLMDEHCTTAMIVVYPDGATPLYRISGVYVYGHRRPSARLYDEVVFPLSPWLDNSFIRTVDMDRLKTGITTLE